MSNFRDWTRDKLKEKFGLKRVYNHPILTGWIEASKGIALDTLETMFFQRIHETMLMYVDYWNEDEVKLKFIGSILTLVAYDTEELSGFSQREIQGTVAGEDLKGIPDFIVAKGKQDVNAPFFFLHEYKKELDNNSPDPAGQCLAAMLLAYELNLQIPEMCEQPIYGTYIIGRMWFFVILKDREYSISLAYDSTHQNQLFDIYRLMKMSKAKIQAIWNE